MRAASFELADMFKSVIPPDYILVPLPTIRKHIRERGFDHIALLCRRTGFPVERLLVRKNDTVQVGSDMVKRKEQARRAYGVKGDIRLDKKYLLVDDVWTTGSSMMAACEVMRAQGVKNLAIAVIARSS